VKILVIAEFYPRGGTYSAVNKLLRLNKELGYEQILLIQRKMAFPELKDYCDYLGIDLRICPDRPPAMQIPLFSLFYDWLIQFFYVRNIRHDLIFVSNSHSWMLIGMFAFKSNSIVYLTHSYPNRYLHLFFSPLYMLTAKLDHNKRFVTVSEYAKKTNVNYLKLESKKVNVIYNSFANELVHSEPNINGNVVLTVGRINPIKNPNVWLAVAHKVSRKIASAEFIWVGGDENQLNTMNENVKKYSGLTSHVKIISYADDIFRYYRQASIYFQPSLSENHSIAVIDAMAAGLPCVVSNVGGMLESVVNDETGFMCGASDVEGFSEKISHLMSDTKLARKLGEKGRKRARKLFSEAAQKNKLKSLYELIST
jgi:glycosyltransferase involved in cell wall biosynthesis